MKDQMKRSAHSSERNLLLLRKYGFWCTNAALGENTGTEKNHTSGWFRKATAKLSMLMLDHAKCI
jgi:hypothetical protein